MATAKRIVSAGIPAPPAERKLRYQHVYDLVLKIVADRGLGPGDRLPSATELAAIAQVSSISVRRALDELERAGKITRRQGLGTFVAEARVVRDPGRPADLLQTLLDSDSDPPAVTTALISVGVGLPGATIATALGIDPGQPVWEIWRKRSVTGRDRDGDNVLERAVLPLSRVPAIDRPLLAAGGSLYRFIEERYDLTDDYTEQAFELDTPNSWEAEHLGLTDDDPIVRVRGVSFDSTGKAFDCFEKCCHATKFTFYTAGHGRHRILGPSGLSNWSVAPLAAPP